MLATIDGATDLSVSFARYWLSLEPADLIPHRAKFAPEAVRGLLANLVIHELVAPDFIKLRLVGTAVVDDYGQEITGRNYLEFVEPERRAKASQAIFNVCQQPCGMLVLLRSISEKGNPLTRESIAFPMRDDDGVAKLVYFCSSPAQERRTFFDEPEALKVITVRERHFIDIGAGLPDFSD